MKDLIAIGLGAVGTFIIIKYLGWMPLLGIFFLVWGNNINLKDVDES